MKSILFFLYGNAIYVKHFTYGTSDLSFEARQVVSSTYVNGSMVTNIQNPNTDTRHETCSERRMAITWQATESMFPEFRPIFVRHSTGGTDLTPTFVTTVYNWRSETRKGRTPVVTSCYSGTSTNPDVAVAWQQDPSNANGSYAYVVAANKVNGSFGSQVTLTTNGRYCTTVQGNASQSTGGALVAYTGASGPIYSITANQGTNGTLSKTVPPRLARGIDIGLADLGVDGLGGIVSLYVEESDGMNFVPASDLSSIARDYLSFSVQSARGLDLAYRLSLLNATLPQSLTLEQKNLVILSLGDTAESTQKEMLKSVTLGDLLALWSKKVNVDGINAIAEMKGLFRSISSGTYKISVNPKLLSTAQEPALYDFVLSSDSTALQKQLVEPERVPTACELFNNYPNPFNPSTAFRFALPMDGHVRLVIYDALGREMARLAEGAFAAGYHTLNWNAQNMASGVYMARLQVTDELGKILFAKTSKLLLMK